MIAITGGPCSGKTTGLAKLVESLRSKGYKVLVSPESATKLILGGITPWELAPAEFQRHILRDTLAQEELFMESAKTFRDQGQKVVILCDRGAMDGQAYVSEGEFEPIVKSLGLSIHDICDRRYHAVIHLTTAALGAEEFYTLANNTARKESAEEARAIDKRTLEAWQRHHHPRVIDNRTDFSGKIRRLLVEVCAILGDPEPIERETKFVIEPIEFTDIPSKVTVSSIVQDYLVSEDGAEHRVRSRKDKHGTLYFHTIKRGISKGVRLEIERMIDNREYEELLDLKDPALHTIVKQRGCFFYQSQFIEVDLFEAPEKCKGLAVMEIEQSSAQADLVLPPFVKSPRDVTGEKEYSNRNLARR